jgi:hypothetical protein
MSSVPQRREIPSHYQLTGPSVRRREWASALLQAADDAAETRRQLAHRERRITALTGQRVINWHWAHDECDLDFALYFSPDDLSKPLGSELLAVDGYPPFPQQRLRCEIELEAELAAGSVVLERVIAKSADSNWPGTN